MLRIKECKALARRTLLGRYSIVIAAYFITIAIKVLMWVFTAISGGMTLFCAGVFGGMLGTGAAFSFPKLVCGVMLTMFLLIATIIVSLWFEIGSTKLMLNICRGLKGSVGDIFYGFKEGSDTLCFIMTGVVLGFITFVINAVQKLLYVLAGKVFVNQTGTHIAAVVIITVISMMVMWYVATTFMFAKIIIADKRESTIGGALRASRRLMKGRKLKGFWLLYFSFLFWYMLMFICGPAALWISPYIVCTTIIFYMDADGTLWQLPGESVEPKAAETQAADENSAETAQDVEIKATEEAHATETVNAEYAQETETAEDIVQEEASFTEENSQIDIASDSQSDIAEEIDNHTSEDDAQVEEPQCEFLQPDLGDNADINVFAETETTAETEELTETEDSAGTETQAKTEEPAETAEDGKHFHDNI